MPSSPIFVDSKTFLSAYQHLYQTVKLPQVVKTYLVGHLSLENQTLFRTVAEDQQTAFLLQELQIVCDAVDDVNRDVFLRSSSANLGPRHTLSPHFTGHDWLDLISNSSIHMSTRGSVQVFRLEFFVDSGLRPPSHHLNIFVECNVRPRRLYYQVSTSQVANLVPTGIVHTMVVMNYAGRVLPLYSTLRSLSIPDFAIFDCVVSLTIRGAGSRDNNDDNNDGGNDDDDGTKVGDPEDNAEPEPHYAGAVVLKWITRGEISKIMNDLAQRVTRVGKDILPLKDKDILPPRSSIPITKTLTFAKQGHPGWTVEVILGSPLKEAEVPPGSEEYVA
eukprot:PhF_6_TR43333/c0_g1_i3/m.66259